MAAIPETSSSSPETKTKTRRPEDEQEREREKMVRVSNNVVGCLNLITLLLSIPIVAGGIWLTSRASTDCEKFLEKPVIFLGVFLLVVSLAGLVGAWCRISLLLWLYLVVMFLLIVVVFCFTIFAFVITNKGAGEVVSGRGYKEYRLGDYSNWLQKRVDAEKNWLKIRSCIQESKVCRRMEERNQTLNEFLRDDLSPLQVFNSFLFLISFFLCLSLNIGMSFLMISLGGIWGCLGLGFLEVTILFVFYLLG